VGFYIRRSGPGRTRPEIYVSGHSEQAQRLACGQGTCRLRVLDTPEKLRPLMARDRDLGIEVCLRLGLVCREARAEAIRVVKALQPDDHSGMRQPPIVSKDDSLMYREATRFAADAEWLIETIWAGLVPFYGPVWASLVGTPEAIAKAFFDYKSIGVTQFIISGCPELGEIATFGREIVPLVRQAEAGRTDRCRIEKGRLRRHRSAARSRTANQGADAARRSKQQPCISPWTGGKILASGNSCWRNSAV
jgi:alkanesulfonate monooxygenase